MSLFAAAVGIFGMAPKSFGLIDPFVAVPLSYEIA
jgi:hypothetical protein